MKVIIIRNGWASADFGGAEELAINLVRVLRDYGHNAIIGSGSNAIISAASHAGLPYLRTPYSSRQILSKHRAIFIPKYILDLHRAYKKYLEIFKEQKPDVVHTTSQQDCIAATKAANKLGIPVIWSDHGELKNSLGFHWLPPWGIPGLFIRSAAKKVQAICMVNPEDISLVNAKLVNINIIRIPNGVPKTMFKTIKTTFTLVFASRVIREKGIFELLEAFELLRSQGKDVSLLIAGSGPSLNSVKQHVQQRRIKSVVFEKYTDEAIQKGLIFVLPTYTEAQSLAIIKAMKYHRPIITTDIPGNQHFLRDGYSAVLVKPRSAESLSHGIYRLLKDPSLRSKIVRGASDFFENEGNFQSIVEKYYIPMYVKAITGN